MAEGVRAQEHILVETGDEDERRSVSLLEGPSLAIIERSCGAVTEAVYASPGHAHKLLCDPSACARVLGAPVGGVTAALERFFLAPEGGEPALLSDLMDSFDRAGEQYAYLSWNDVGDVAIRSDGTVGKEPRQNLA